MSDRSTHSVQRRAPIGRKPAADPATTWVRQADGTDAQARASIYTARLTINVTPTLRGCIKVTAFQRGVTAADMLRELLEREYGGTRSDDPSPYAGAMEAERAVRLRDGRPGCSRAVGDAPLADARRLQPE